MQEYVVSNDANEAQACVRAIGAPLAMHELVKQAVVKAMSDDCKAQIFALLDQLNKNGVISHGQYGKVSTVSCMAASKTGISSHECKAGIASHESSIVLHSFRPKKPTLQGDEGIGPRSKFPNFMFWLIWVTACLSRHVCWCSQGKVALASLSTWSKVFCCTSQWTAVWVFVYTIVMLMLLACVFWEDDVDEIDDCCTEVNKMYATLRKIDCTQASWLSSISPDDVNRSYLPLSWVINLMQPCLKCHSSGCRNIWLKSLALCL